MDAINNKIVSVKESGAAKVELLSRKCEEIVEEVHGHLSTFTDLCVLFFLLGLNSFKVHPYMPLHEKKMKIEIHFHDLVYIGYTSHVASSFLLLF